MKYGASNGNYLEKAFKMIEDYLDDKITPYDFSCNFEVYIFDNCKKMESEDTIVADEIEGVFLEICDYYANDGDIDSDPVVFKRMVQKEYNRIMRECNININNLTNIWRFR